MSDPTPSTSSGFSFSPSMFYRRRVENIDDVGSESSLDDDSEDLLDISSESDAEDGSFDDNVPESDFGVKTTYDGDSSPLSIAFKPSRDPGVHLSSITRSDARKFTKAIDFFLLFFTSEVISTICDNTNKYAWSNILDKTSYSKPDGSWEEVTADELMKFLGIIIYMGIVRLPRIKKYWSVSSLYKGNLVATIMPRGRFLALLAMLHVSDHDIEDSSDKLRKVHWLIDVVNDSSSELFQPYQNIAVDERMVRSKQRSGIRQYMKDKRTKFGYKLWVIADSSTGYTLQFCVYTGKREQGSEKGLAYDVVMKLTTRYLDQGYVVYMDNFYSSRILFEDLLHRKTLACGTVRKDRRGFPIELKSLDWEKTSERGDIRWKREADILFLQWKDRKVVNMMSSGHCANDFAFAERTVKIDNEWKKIKIRKPTLIEEYNVGMLGVDRSDQLIESYNVLHKCVRWWKTIFFHIIDTACVNAYILFQIWRVSNPHITELHRGTSYDQLAFREELVSQLLDSKENRGKKKVKETAQGTASLQHIPACTSARRNCKMCFRKLKIERKTSFMCKSCQVYLCLTQKKNCFHEWHK